MHFEKECHGIRNERIYRFQMCEIELEQQESYGYVKKKNHKDVKLGIILSPILECFEFQAFARLLEVNAACNSQNCRAAFAISRGFKDDVIPCLVVMNIRICIQVLKRTVWRSARRESQQLAGR